MDGRSLKDNHYSHTTRRQAFNKSESTSHMLLRLPFESRWRLKKQLLYLSFKQQNKIMSFLSVCIGWLCSSCSSWLVVWGGRCFSSLPNSLSLKPIVGWLRTAHKQVNILPQKFTPCLCLNSHPSIFIALLAASSLHCLQSSFSVSRFHPSPCSVFDVLPVELSNGPL